MVWARLQLVGWLAFACRYEVVMLLKGVALGPLQAAYQRQASKLLDS